MDSIKTNCTNTEEILDAFHDNELSAEEHGQIQKHVESCTVCTTKLSQIGQVVDVLKNMPRVSMPAEASAKLDRLFDQPAKVVPFQRRLVAPIAVAAAVAAICIGLRVGAPVGTSDPIPQIATTKKIQPSQETIAQQTASQKSTSSERNTVPADELDKNENTPSPVVASVPAQSSEPQPNTRETTGAKATAASQPKSSKQTVAPHSTHSSATAVAANSRSHEDELAELPCGSSNSFNDAVGISTDEDGLYDLKM